MSGDYPAGSIKHHPEWPDTPEIAMRTAFHDGQFPGWTSWMRVHPAGSEFVNPDLVADWPDATFTDTPDP